MNVLAIQRKGCPHVTSVVLPTTLHNIRNMFKPEKQILILNKDTDDKRITRVEILYGSKRAIRCPSGIFGDRYINYTPGTIGFYSYLTGYLMEVII